MTEGIEHLIELSDNGMIEFANNHDNLIVITLQFTGVQFIQRKRNIFQYLYCKQTSE